MSFYPDMIRPAPGGQTRAYTLIINEFGEVVVCQLDNDGKPTGFVAMKSAHEMLSALAQTLYKDIGSVQVKAHLDGKWTCNGMLRVLTWAEVVTILHGKSSVKKARLQERVHISPVSRYIIWDSLTRLYSVTDLGKKLDTMHDATGSKE